MEQRAGLADRLGAFWLVTAECALLLMLGGDYEKSWYYYG